MNSFLLPLGAIFVLLFLARRFVRHHETLQEHHDRLRKRRDGGFRDLEQHNAAMEAAEALAPLRLALQERLDEAGLTANALPRASLALRGHSLCVTPVAPDGTAEPVFCVRWERRVSHFSSLQRGRDVTRGFFVLARHGHPDERHDDLDALEKRCAALLARGADEATTP